MEPEKTKLVSEAISRIGVGTGNLASVLVNLKSKSEFEIRRICRGTNSGHFTGLMVAIAELERLPFKAKTDTSLGQGVGNSDQLRLWAKEPLRQRVVATARSRISPRGLQRFGGRGSESSTPATTAKARTKNRIRLLKSPAILGR